MAKTEFRKIVNDKGYTFKELMKLWDVSARQLTRWSASGKTKYINMAQGLPPKTKEKAKIKGRNQNE